MEIWVIASIYRKRNSPFWWVQFIDASGARKNKSTGLLANDPGQTVRARALRAQLEAKELSRTESKTSHDSWDNWVLPFLERHCKSKSPLTFERYKGIWQWIALWLQEKKYHSPRSITYRRGLEYLDWRLAHKKKSGSFVCRNTAILELKVFAMIMDEAVRLEHIEANPLFKLKLDKDRPAKKPEITNTEIKTIRIALKREPEWMQIAFEIALHTGCRLSETRIPLDCINFSENKITFPSPKGGEDRAFSIPMPSALRQVFRRLARQRRIFTLDLPFQASRCWQRLFARIGMDHLCFHCLRVTYVNRLRRAGVPRDAAMRLVNHASELVHKIYPREKVEDVMQWRDAVKFD